MRPVRNTACAITATILATACGGGGGGGGSSETTGSTSTATGVLKDANVAGLQYRSGSRSGTTDASDEFTYEVGETVTFFIGGVTGGTADGAGITTPIDLADGDSVSSTDVVNRVRFLLFLDSDGDPDNGIQISSGVRDMTDNWNQVNFNSGECALLACVGRIQHGLSAI
jgi:para-nitrobenzyl esterase